MAASEAGGAGQIPGCSMWVPQDTPCHIAYPFGHPLFVQKMEDFHLSVQDWRVVFRCFSCLFKPQKPSMFPSVTYCLLC